MVRPVLVIAGLLFKNRGGMGRWQGVRGRKGPEVVIQLEDEAVAWSQVYLPR